MDESYDTFSKLKESIGSSDQLARLKMYSQCLSAIMKCISAKKESIRDEDKDAYFLKESVSFLSQLHECSFSLYKRISVGDEYYSTQKAQKHFSTLVSTFAGYTNFLNKYIDEDSHETFDCDSLIAISES